MCQQCRLDPRTATADQSIWRGIPERIFRRHLVTLEERTNAVPVKPLALPPTEPAVQDVGGETRLLPPEVEQQLANDLAYIAAVGEGAQSVSAVCVEERSAPCGLTIRLAAVDALSEELRHALQEIGCMLAEAATNTVELQDRLHEDALQKLIVTQHFSKLLGRLRSRKWKKPAYLSRTHKKALWQDFDNLIHRVQFAYPKKKDLRKRTAVEAQLKDLAGSLERFEHDQGEVEAEIAGITAVIDACHTFCKIEEVQQYATSLEIIPHATPQIAAALKTLRQVEKIGAYRRVAHDLLISAHRFPTLFQNIQFQFLSPYTAVGTDTAFESWATILHVHAEIQLIVHYDLGLDRENHTTDVVDSVSHHPRVIGTSKNLCYLCYLFITKHGRFTASHTHGRLYDQWTIPDLSDFAETVSHKYMSIIRDMDDEIVRLSDSVGPREGKRDSWRVEPMTSRQNLLSIPPGNQNGRADCSYP